MSGLVRRKGNVGILSHGEHSSSFEIMTTNSRQQIEDRVEYKSSSNYLNNIPRQYGEYFVFNFGKNNDLPDEIRDTVAANHLAPRILTKRKLLTWGNGPVLKKVEMVEGKREITIVDDTEVQAWLDNMDYLNYTDKVLTDYLHLELTWSKVIPTNGFKVPRLNALKVSRVDHVAANEAREANKTGHRKEVTHGVIGDWQSHFVNDYRGYPLINWAKTLTTPALHCSKLYSFGIAHHTLPDITGLLPWLRNSNVIPFILEYYRENSLNIKWHIISPQAYWDKKREALEMECKINEIEYDEQMLEDLKDEKFDALAKVLAGVQNVGKFFTSESVLEIIGNTPHLHEWKIIPIDQKVKEFIDAQLAVSKHVNMQTVAGAGLHQALSNVAADGKSDSGSEQHYAFNNFKLSEVQMTEVKVFEVLNKCIALNWPDKKIFLGFHHDMAQRQEEITSKDRLINADPAV